MCVSVAYEWDQHVGCQCVFFERFESKASKHLVKIKEKMF